MGGAYSDVYVRTGFRHGRTIWRAVARTASPGNGYLATILGGSFARPMKTGVCGRWRRLERTGGGVRAGLRSIQGGIVGDFSGLASEKSRRWIEAKSEFILNEVRNAIIGSRQVQII